MRTRDRHVAWTLQLIALGVMLVAGSVVVRGRRLSMDPAIVTVNAVEIKRAQFDAEASTVGASSPAARQRLLAYLVDEELLVQRAREIGLLESDQQLRRLIVRRTIDTLTRSPNPSVPVAVSELWEFYRTHPELSQGARRFAVQAVSLQGSAAATSALRSRMTERMRDTRDSLLSVAHSEGISPLDVPTGVVSAAELEPHLGADAVSQLVGAHAGDLLSVAVDKDHLILVQVLDVKTGSPGLQWPQQGGAIESAYRMAQASRALCAALKTLWRQTEIWVDPEIREFVRSAADPSCKRDAPELAEEGG